MSKNRKHKKKNLNVLDGPLFLRGYNYRGPGLVAQQNLYWQSADYNQRLFYVYRDQVLALALNRFRWHNLPKTCNARYLESVLLTHGAATIAFPAKLPGKFFSTLATYDSKPNVYDNPSRWRSFGNNGWQFKVTPENGVYIWDNMTRHSILPAIDMYARELADLVRTRQLNRMHQKVPWVLTGPQERKNDMENALKQALGGEPAIIAGSSYQDIKVEPFTFNVPFLGEELSSDEKNVWHEIYSLLGISNLPFKAERQVSDEIDTYEEPTDLMKENFLTPRREACDILNARFGKYLEQPISVTWNRDYETHNANIVNDLNATAQFLEESGLGVESSTPSARLCGKGY